MPSKNTPQKTKDGMKIFSDFQKLHNLSLIDQTKCLFIYLFFLKKVDPAEKK